MSELRRFQSHKIVHAEPMTRAEFDNHQGLNRPATLESYDELGYRVVYNKDTSDHYESWCPKEIFEAGNTEIDDE